MQSSGDRRNYSGTTSMEQKTKSPQTKENTSRNRIEIFVLVGKLVRPAMARFNAAKTVAYVDTPHGPIEFRKWHSTERAAKLAATKKART